MKKVTTSLLLVLSFYLNNAQDLPVLTKQQMYNDFDTLAKTIIDISPQYVVRKKITGLDLENELKFQRNKLKRISTTREFLLLVQSTLSLCQDGHTSLLKQNYFPSDTDYLEEGLSKEALKWHSVYDSTIQVANAKQFNLPLKYLQGEYYTISTFTFNHKVFTAGLKLIECNGMPIHDYVGKLYPYKRMMRWDFQHHRYFSEDFYKNFSLTASDSLQLSFVDSKGKVFKGNFSLNQPLTFELPINSSSEKIKKVEYWPDEEVLYIRIPEMVDESFYPTLIQKEAYGKPLKKVVLDIRNNPGGSDGVWVNILSSIIKTPISYTNFILCNNSSLMRSKFPEKAKNWKAYQDPNFKGHTYAIFSNDETKIEPDSNSLNYIGPIYILQNENIYSSAGSLAATGVLASQLTTVGTPTGRLLGKGINPMLFELPNSKIMYRIEPVIDFLNVKRPEDVFHDKVEIPVNLTIQQYLERLEYQGDVYSKDFLLKKDPVFRTIMEL